VVREDEDRADISVGSCPKRVDVKKSASFLDRLIVTISP
jgi:hypothetical protein